MSRLTMLDPDVELVTTPEIDRWISEVERALEEICSISNDSTKKLDADQKLRINYRSKDILAGIAHLATKYQSIKYKYMIANRELNSKEEEIEIAAQIKDLKQCVKSTPNPAPQAASFADAVKIRKNSVVHPTANNSIAIYPANKDSSSDDTKKLVQTLIKPDELKLHIRGVRNTKNGGVIISTNGKEDLVKLQKSEKLIESGLTLEVAAKRRPKIILLGVPSSTSEAELKDCIYEQNIAGNLTTEQISKLKEWSANLDADQQKFLTREGQDEMVQLAERMQKRFPNVVKNKYSNESFLFRYTATQRAQQSARYFTIGLFDHKKSQDVLFEPATKVDPVLRFYKHCDKWQKQVKKNQSTYMEQRAFGHSRQMNNTLESVSKRLGLEYVLSLESVILMYKICGFESSWNRHHMSPWCYGFDKDSAEVCFFFFFFLGMGSMFSGPGTVKTTPDYLVGSEGSPGAENLEYYHDLQHYWMDGYGYDLTYRQACLSIKNMFETFRNKTGPNATFYFAHSGTILKVFAHLQLFKPATPLRADVIQRDRAWKTSHIDCFAANLAFVLFKCKDGNHVLTLHQEKIIKLPMCEKELCPLEHLVQHFHESIYNCDYSDMCRLNNENTL
ncbi:histidine phosphatase superfamily (branch 2) domain-containing protein [Phthorimaea operculella]|nr:histidine phosphatase superfamily (branch 2) domain-containing protein [Phthorimaea operculella]